ncbi:MAG: hypothetical protein Q9M24_07870 [Mariprofundaceae bacterium]|nr:hypothetical protein [Mariprofundaceae bacterium]
MAALVLNASILNIFTEARYATAGEDDIYFRAPVVEPARGSVSSEDTRADRAAKLKVKMKAIEEGTNRPVAEEVVVPIGHRSVRGSDAIKAKIEASKDSGKKGTAKMQGYINGFMGGLQSLSNMLSDPEDREKLSTRQKERKMSFKERLKLELEKKRERNFVREQ